MFEQEINEAALKTYKQGYASVDEDFKCAYSNGKGGRCAVGHMMTDEEAEKFSEFEGNAAALVGKGWRQDLTETQVGALNSLQMCHDSAQHAKSFRDEFLFNLKNTENLREVAQYVEDNA